MHPWAGILEEGLTQRVVDVSEFAVSAAPDTLLVTYALGSSVGVAAYDPLAEIGGLLHCMLPWSRMRPGEAFFRPGMFVDTGVPALIDEMLSRGADHSRLVLKAAGCGQMIVDGDSIFCLGEENRQALRQALDLHGLNLAAEHTGGMLARTLRLNVATGELTVNAGGLELSL